MKDLCFKSTSLLVLLAFVETEHLRQLNKWGVQDRTLFEWLTYTAEELGELAKAVAEFTYRKGTPWDIANEALQTATLCLKIAEMGLSVMIGGEQDARAKSV